MVILNIQNQFGIRTILILPVLNPIITKPDGSLLTEEETPEMST
jgi:hypothetical protein